MRDDELPLPELLRSLRTLGAARDAASQAAHDAIFAPLIAARLRASHAEWRDVVRSLHGATLAESIERASVAAATTGTMQPAMARARSARARDLLDPLRDALAALDDRAGAALDAGTESREWRDWLDALRHAFATADDACRQLARLLATPPDEGARLRWYERRRR
ncbi:MAG TPA: hypothetical protein VL328_07625 [Gemmatimonadaceae bacterium]|jgi:hypothetical protein|nr:hypothetical protein [Gemmatimonadaceae bacterium]